MKNSILVLGLLFLAMSGFTSKPARAQDAGGIQAAAPAKADYVLFVEVKVKPESVVDFKRAILAIVDSTQAEDGNLAYVVHQSPDDSTDFMVYEHWQSDEDHVRHLNSPTFVNYSKSVAPMIQSGYPARKKMVVLDQNE